MSKVRCGRVFIVWAGSAWVLGLAIASAAGGKRDSDIPTDGLHRVLTFGERVAYQYAIEQVYWRHRVWPKENAEPKPRLEAIASHGLAPQDPMESGIYASLPPGAFTVILAGKNGVVGLGLVEIYNLQ